MAMQSGGNGRRDGIIISDTPAVGPVRGVMDRGAARSPGREMEAYLFEIHLVAEETMLLPSKNKGNVFRGALGRGLRGLVCPDGAMDCGACAYMGCAYRQFFEPVNLPGSGKLGGNRNIQRPFVIRPPLEERVRYLPGDSFAFGMVLFGRGIMFLPHLLASLRAMASGGIGPGRGRARLEGVTQVHPLTGERHALLDAGGMVSLRRGLGFTMEDFPHRETDRAVLRFHTPVILKDGGRFRQVPGFGAVVRRLRDRLAALSWFYGGMVPEMDFRSFARQADLVEIARSDIRYHQAERRSRGRVRQGMGGFSGTVEYRGPLAPYVRLLLFGQYLHLGKATAFGYGWYDAAVG